MTRPKAVFDLMYISRCTVAPEHAPAAIDAILEASVRRNDAHGVTGALLFADTHFIQVLEGDERDVEAVMARIERDPRHDGMQVLQTRMGSQRSFGDWRMAFVTAKIYMRSHLDDLLHLGSGRPSRFDPVGRMRELMMALVREAY